MNTSNAALYENPTKLEGVELNLLPAIHIFHLATFAKSLYGIERGGMVGVKTFNMVGVIFHITWSLPLKNTGSC